MPVYEYVCKPAGHRTSVLRKMEDRNLPVACDCGMLATLAVSAPSVGIVAGSSNPCRTNPHRAAEPAPRPDRIEANAFRVVDFVCPNEHTDFEVVPQSDDWTPTPCKTCGEITRRVWAMPALDAWTARGLHASGGEWNASLGRWIKSPEHLREVCAEMQVRPSEEDSSALLRQAERKAKEDAEDREVFEMFQQEDASIKKARDQGLVPDDTWAVKALEAAHPNW